MLSKLFATVLWPLKFFLRLSWKKKLLTIVLLLAGFIGISIYFGANQKPQYTSAIAEKDNIVEVVSETGNIIATGRTDVYSPTNGVVTEIYIQNGDVVTDGDNLFKVDSSATEQEQQQAYAAYLAATNTLNAARAQMHALQSEKFEANQAFLNDRGVDNPSQDQKDDPVYIQQESDWLKAEADYINQEKVINQAQANVTSTWLAYQATQNATVKAPIDGTVSNLSINVGSGVRIQSVSQPVRPALALSSASDIAVTEVEVALSESDIAKVKEGQKATIDVVAVDDKTYDGIVRRFDTIGTNDNGVIRYNVYLEVLKPDDKLRPGMNVDVDIVTNSIENVLTVPNSAVKPYQGGRAVRVYDASKNEIIYVPVEIGIRGEEKTQILNGIEEGQEIVISLSNEDLARPGLFGS